MKQVFAVLVGLVYLIVLAQQQPASAAVLFSEDFTDGVTHWKALRDSGQMWTSYPGYAEAYVPYKSTVTELAPVFWTKNESSSFLYKLRFTPLQGADRNISFAFQDLDNWYQIHFAQGVTEVSKYKNNVRVWVHQSPYTLLNGIEYQTEILFDAGKIKLVLNGNEILSTEDPTYSGESGIITLRVGTGSIFPTKVRFSDVQVLDLQNDEVAVDSGFKLSIDALKQTDPRWKDLEYDTASVWSSSTGSTFADWACNLVSQVMILRYHGITTLPDGTQLDPVSYNQWLLASSGYWHSPQTGNITRTSASKLALLMNKVKSSPKLEFVYTPTPQYSVIGAEIDAGRPAILELDGHFVVAYGYTDNYQDIYIHDPAYSVELLSKHPLALKSMRSYIPSQTDLRYLEVISDPDLHVELTTSGQAVGTISSEYLRRFSEGSTDLSPIQNILFIAKPEFTQYQLSIKNESDEARVATLNITGSDNQILLEHQIISDAASHQDLIVDYSSEAAANVEHTDTSVSDYDSAEETQAFWSQFRELVLALNTLKEIRRPNVSTVLLKMVTVVEKAPSTYIGTALKQMMKITLEALPSSAISDHARSKLLELLV